MINIDNSILNILSYLDSQSSVTPESHQISFGDMSCVSSDEVTSARFSSFSDQILYDDQDESQLFTASSSIVRKIYLLIHQFHCFSLRFHSNVSFFPGKSS